MGSTAVAERAAIGVPCRHAAVDPVGAESTAVAGGAAIGVAGVPRSLPRYQDRTAVVALTWSTATCHPASSENSFRTKERAEKREVH